MCPWFHQVYQNLGHVLRAFRCKTNLHTLHRCLDRLVRYRKSPAELGLPLNQIIFRVKLVLHC